MQRYNEIATAGYIKYDIPRRMTALEEAVKLNNYTFTKELERQYQCIHAQAYSIRRKAEKRCRRKATGQVPWSPQI